jgi:cytochrome c551/c552
MLKRSCLLAALAIAGGCLLVFGLIQLIPYGRNHTNPPVVVKPTWDSQLTKTLAQRACFDCHSNETTWIWYTDIAPVSWLTQSDVDRGRRRLNFSDWTGSGRGVGELAETISRGSMPPFYYVWMHPTANLSAAEKQQLINGLAASLK